MSKIALEPNAAGTGTFSIASPNSNTNRTLTLPDETGTVLTDVSTFAGTGPAFSASLLPNQYVSNNVLTKVQLSIVQYDTAGNFDSATNYRFTPSIEGYYQISAAVRGGANTGTLSAANCLICKNGSEIFGAFITGSFGFPSAFNEANSTGSALVYMNGSTDYIELYGKIVGTSPYFGAAFLTGFLARAAS